MRAKFSRQIWAFDTNYTRVEALDPAGQPLGYVYFVPRTHRRHSEPQASLFSFVAACVGFAWLGAALGSR
ncbi:hypothetical protein [Anatilimnocola floriformis]|uniref:hypothetical protein n=1 Tax=Anatilimnocola floriformis TaxID=2948575 RepID=UPI0020C479DB|nr:hypothetical protein [Anatilimnocola floriformis]